MTTLQTSQLKDGSRIAYDDGRGEAQATVLTVEHWGMRVQFDDRADTTAIRFTDKAWMQWLEVVEV